MSIIENSIAHAKLDILGIEPEKKSEKIIYEQARVQLEGYIEIFERTLSDPFNMHANASVLGLHLSGIALAMQDKKLLKIQDDMGSTIYTDACQRFIDYYKMSIPTP